MPGLALLWRRGSEERHLRITKARPHGDRMLLCFEGVVDVEGARSLAGGDLCVGEEQAFRAGEGFYYSHDIAGFRCEGTDGALIGTAGGLEQTAAGPLLTVDTPRQKGALVPFVEGIVVRVDREARRIVLDPPAGLFDL